MSGAPSVTPERIASRITAEIYTILSDGRTTLCQLRLVNGFSVLGTSACVCAENFDRAIGQRLARADAVSKIWPLEGYLLAERLHNGEVV